MDKLKSGKRVEATQEILARVVAAKSHLRRCRTAGLINSDELVGLMEAANISENIARYVVAAAENEYARLGAGFAPPLSAPEFAILKK